MMSRWGIVFKFSRSSGIFIKSFVSHIYQVEWLFLGISEQTSIYPRMDAHSRPKKQFHPGLAWLSRELTDLQEDRWNAAFRSIVNSGWLHYKKAHLSTGKNPGRLYTWSSWYNMQANHLVRVYSTQQLYNSGEGPWGCCTFDKLLGLISFLSFLPVMIGLYQLWYKPESFERRNACARLGCGQTCGHFLERCGRAQLTVSSVTPGQMCYYEQWFWSAG